MSLRSIAVVPLMGAAVIPLSVGIIDPPAASPSSGPVVTCARADTLEARRAEYYDIELRPPASTLGDRQVAGRVEVTYPSSPFGLSLTREGTLLQHLRVVIDERWRSTRGRLVAWVASPDLDRVRNLGEIEADGTVSGEVGLNKFLVFVTEEPAAAEAADRWRGPVVLKGKSRSGRMQSMASHGMFEREPC